MAPGTEFARVFCAGIGPLHLGVVLVFMIDFEKVKYEFVKATLTIDNRHICQSWHSYLKSYLPFAVVVNVHTSPVRHHALVIHG